MHKRGLRAIEKLTLLSTADVHIHTCNSDAKPNVPQVLDYVENQTNLDVIAICDHDTMVGAFEAEELLKEKKYHFELVMGEEITSLQGHILGLFLTEPVRPGQSALETVEAIHAQGGLAVASHPFERSRWNNRERPMMDGVGFKTLVEINHKFDGIEVINATPTLGDENIRAALVNKALLFQAELGNSDAHIVEAIGKGYTLFEGKTAADFKKAIVQHQTRAMSDKWTILAIIKYAYFFTPHALRILWNTILHGKTKLPEE